MNTTKSLRTFQRTFRQAFRSHHAPFRIANEPGARVFPVPVQRIARTASSRFYSAQTESHQRPLTDRTDSPVPTTPPSELPSSQPKKEKGPSQPLSKADELALRKAISPAYQLHFTCKKCLKRSTHTVSKQAYHFGTCVINCPECKSNHLISDNLKIFGDTNRTMEDIAKEHGELLRKGRLGTDGQVEFYDAEADRLIQEDAEQKAQKAQKARAAEERQAAP